MSVHVFPAQSLLTMCSQVLKNETFTFLPDLQFSLSQNYGIIDNTVEQLLRGKVADLVRGKVDCVFKKPWT